MAKEKKSVSMGAAECARRTGLTVRALRVYERHQLIEPRRTGKGWRCYGPLELRRLNVIVTLKAFGMTLVRELINENLTPEEERAVMTWVAARPPDEMKAMHECAPAILDLHRSFQDLREKNVDPAAPEAQALVARLNEVVVRSGARNHRATLFEWNTPVALKWIQFGERLMSKRIISSQSAAPDEGLAAYIYAAQVASPWHRALEPVVDEAAMLVNKRAQPSAALAQALVGRLRQICADHSLGDPLVYVRWARAMQIRWPTADNAPKQAGWALLADAIKVAPSAT
jgi:DNA-binding transcriptional MerR regulator